MNTTIADLAFSGSLGLLYLLLGVPLYLEKIPQNGFYGFRLAKTLENDEVWYKSNKRLGLGFSVGGVILILGAIVSYYLNLTKSSYTYGNIGLLIFVTLVCCIDSFLFLKKIDS